MQIRKAKQLVRLYERLDNRLHRMTLLIARLRASGEQHGVDVSEAVEQWNAKRDAVAARIVKLDSALSHAFKIIRRENTSGLY